MKETEHDMSYTQQTTSHPEDRSFMGLVLDGETDLAITYWLLFLAGSGIFFVFGSDAVAALSRHRHRSTRRHVSANSGY